MGAVEVKLEEFLRGRRLVAVLVASTVLVGAIATVVFEIPKYVQLINRGILTEGSITELQTLNHGSVIYQYQVGEHTFGGGGHAGDIYKKFDELRLGQKVAVFHDPENPEVSSLGEPEKHLKSLLVLAVFLTISPSLCVIGLTMRRILKQT